MARRRRLVGPFGIAEGVIGGGGSPSSLLTGIVAGWKLDEASDGSDFVQRNDSIGVNHLSDPVKIPSAAGIIGNGALSSTGKNLSRADTADLSTGDIDFTFSGWVKATSLVNNSGVLGKWGGSPEYALLYIVNRFQFSVQNAAGAQSNAVANNFGLPGTGAWIHLVFGHDATANRIFIKVNNGETNYVNHADGVRDSNGDFLVGKYSGTSQSWDGAIDELYLWKRLLTDTEIAALYNGGLGKTHPF